MRFLIFYTNFNSYILPNIIKDLLFYVIPEVILANEGNYLKKLQI